MRFAIAVICLSLLTFSAGDNYFNKIIKHINSGHYGWKAAPNHVTEMGRKAHLLTGSKFPSNDAARTLNTVDRVSHTPIPESFDSRDYWSSCPSIWSIKDQGGCGTCWAVSTASVMSDRVCIASAGKIQVNISAEQLAACCTDCGLGCNGGYPDKAWPYFLEHGLVTGGDYNSKEGCQPYEVPGGQSSNMYLQCSPKSCTNKKYPTPYKKDLHFGKTAYYLPNDAKAIQAELMTNGPVVAGFTVYDDFFSYRSGVYRNTTRDLAGGHAVRIIGWGVEDGVDYWLIANSWNRSWGDNGYVKFIREINNCGIEEFVTAGLVDSD